MSTLTVLHPKEGKRYRLHLHGDLSSLPIAKLRALLHQRLSPTAQLPPLSALVLRYRGVPLTGGGTCGGLGLGNGGVLEISEAGTMATGGGGGGVVRPEELYSPQRPQLEEETIRQQEKFLRQSPGPSASTPPQSSPISPLPPPPQSHHNNNNNNNSRNIFDASIKKYDDAVEAVRGSKKALQDQRDEADRRLKEILEKEREATEEKEKLIRLRQLEEEKREERKKELEQRRQLLRQEEEDIKELQLLQLENEKKKNLLIVQKQIHQSERERVFLEQDSYDTIHKQRELLLREREIEAEQAALFHRREQRELKEDRILLLRQKLRYYNQQQVEPPAALLEELEREMHNDANGNGYMNNNTNGSYLGNKSASLLHSNTIHNNNNNNRNTSRNNTHPTNNNNSHPSPYYTNQSGISPNIRVNPYHGAPSGRDPISIYRSTSSPSQGHRDPPPAGPVVVLEDGGYYDAYENAVENLNRLGEALQLPPSSEGGLTFDENHTCVISLDNEFTLLLTFDPITERLFLYSTLLTNLPEGETELKLKLYEYLLECSLLGREMCGGGIGASMQPNFNPNGDGKGGKEGNQNFILLSSSIYLPTSQPWTLKTTVPQFVECLRYWRKAVRDFIENYQQQRLPRGAAPPSSTNLSLGSTVPSQSFPNRSTDVIPQLPVPTARGHSQPLHPQTLSTLGLEITDRLSLSAPLTDHDDSHQSSQSTYHYKDAVLVVSVTGPAALAGVLPHDLIKHINGVPLQSPTVAHCKSLLSRVGQGERVELLCERQSLPVRIIVTVGALQL